MGIIVGLNVCSKPPQIRLVTTLWVVVRPASEKPTQGVHGSHGGLHLQTGALVFALIECDLFAFESGSKDFLPGVQGQTFFALRFVHGR